MTEVRVYRDSDCDRSVLENKRIAVVGYGSQGRAFARNLSDSGCDVTVHLRDDSGSRERVAKDGLRMESITAVAGFEIVILAFPDHEQPEFYDHYFANHNENRVFVLLHGSNFHFGNIVFYRNHDVILIAPHGPGTDLRDNYVSGTGLSCFFAIGQDASGMAKSLGLALASAIGAGKAGIYETTFHDETVGDLFGEQTLLVGGLAGLTDAVFRTLVDKGIPPVNAYLETIAQLRLLSTMIEKHGPGGMIARVSKTAAFGSLLAMPSLFDETFHQRLEAIYYAIEGGEFNQLLRDEAKSGFRDFEGLMKLMMERKSQKITEQFAKDEPKP